MNLVSILLLRVKDSSGNESTPEDGHSEGHYSSSYYIVWRSIIRNRI